MLGREAQAQRGWFPTLASLAQLSLSTRYALAAVSGALNGAAFVFNGALTPFAHLPLLTALWGLNDHRHRAALGALVGLSAGAHIYGVVSYGWLFFYAFAILCGLQMALFGLLLGPRWRAQSAWLAPLTPACIWVLTEWLRTLGPLSMPASYAGCIAQVELLLPWLRFASVGGGLMVSGLVALCPGLLFFLIFGRGGARRWALFLTVLLCALPLFGPRPPAELGVPISVAGVQGGFPNRHYSAVELDPQLGVEIVESYERQSAAAFAAGAELVIWPETALQVPLLGNAPLERRLFPRGHQQALIAGLQYRDQERRRWNVAASISGGELQGISAKVKTIPRSEGDLTPGEDWWPLPTPHGPVGAMICFESLYAEAGRRLTLRGARFLTVMSNDAGFGYSPISAHMLNRAIIRAIENQRWLLRVGQAGLTALIDPGGRIRGQLSLFAQATLEGRARLLDTQSLFTRWGHWWLPLPLFLLMIGLSRPLPGPLPAPLLHSLPEG